MCLLQPEDKVYCMFWDFQRNGEFTIIFCILYNKSSKLWLCWQLLIKCVCVCVCLPGGKGGWNSRGCVTSSISPNRTSCLCDHLTHFAVLLVSRSSASHKWNPGTNSSHRQRHTVCLCSPGLLPTACVYLCQLSKMLMRHIYNVWAHHYFFHRWRLWTALESCLPSKSSYVLPLGGANPGFKCVLCIKYILFCFYVVSQDVSRTHISPADSQILTVISYLGCGISSIFLGVTLLTYLAFEWVPCRTNSNILTT